MFRYFLCEVATLQNWLRETNKPLCPVYDGWCVLHPSPHSSFQAYSLFRATEYYCPISCRRMCASGGSRQSPGHDFQSFQLQPLAELEVIGACRRGRRRGRRNRTMAERQSEIEQRRRSKNARERQRVENVKKEYAKLQQLLGLESNLDDKSREKRRHCKLRTLTEAIKRIRSLIDEQKRLRADRSVPAAVSRPQSETSVHPAPSLHLPAEEVNSSYTGQSLDSSPCTSIPHYGVAGPSTLYPCNDTALLQTSSAYSSMETHHQEYPASSCPPISCTVKVPHYFWYPASNFPQNPPFPRSSPIPYMSSHSVGPDVPTSYQPAPCIDFWSSTMQVAME